MPETTVQERAARRIAEDILREPENLDRAKRILRRTPRNLFSRVLALLRARLAALIASTGPAAVAVGLWALWNYLMFLHVAAAFAVIAGSVTTWEWFRQAMRLVRNLWRGILDALEECLKLGLITQAQYDEILQCLRGAYGAFRRDVRAVTREFDAQHEGKTEYYDAFRIFMENGYRASLSQAWQRFVERAQKCIEGIDCGALDALLNMAAIALEALSEETEVVAGGQAIGSLEPEALRRLPLGLSLGYPGRDGFSHDEVREDPDAPVVNPNASLEYFSKQQLIERKDMLRRKLRELQRVETEIDEDIRRAREAGDSVDLETFLRAAQINEGMQARIIQALQRAYTACLRFVDPLDDEEAAIVLQLRALESGSVLTEQEESQMSSLQSAENDFDEAQSLLGLPSEFRMPPRAFGTGPSSVSPDSSAGELGKLETSTSSEIIRVPVDPLTREILIDPQGLRALLVTEEGGRWIDL